MSLQKYRIFPKFYLHRLLTFSIISLWLDIDEKLEIFFPQIKSSLVTRDTRILLFLSHVS